MKLIHVINMLLKEINSKIPDNNKKNYLDDEMDMYNLSEEERELVKNGEYDPWDFDTEGPFEEDDYYDDDYDYDDD